MAVLKEIGERVTMSIHCWQPFASKEG